MKPFKSREISGEFSNLVEKFIKKGQKQLRQRTMKIGMKILDIFGENRVKFVGKCMIIKICGIISIGQLKLSEIPEKFCVFGSKMNKTLKNFRKV